MSRSLEYRLERLELAIRPSFAGAVDILIYGVGRNDAGGWAEDAQPGIVLRIPASEVRDEQKH